MALRRAASSEVNQASVGNVSIWSPVLADAHQHVGRKVDAQWFNLLIGRLYGSSTAKRGISNHLHSIITHKLSRGSKDSYLKNILVKQVELGAIPRISDVSITRCSEDGSGDIVFDLDLNFDSVFSVLMTFDVAVESFLSFTVPVSVWAKVSKIRGKAQATIKPAPSNRLWLGFYPPGPESFELDVQPTISSMSVRLNFITEILRFHFNTILQENLVLPNSIDFAFVPNAMIDTGMVAMNGSPVDLTLVLPTSGSVTSPRSVLPSLDPVVASSADIEPTETSPAMLRHRHVNNPTI